MDNSTDVLGDRVSIGNSEFRECVFIASVKIEWYFFSVLNFLWPNKNRNVEVKHPNFAWRQLFMDLIGWNNNFLLWEETATLFFYDKLSSKLDLHNGSNTFLNFKILITWLWASEEDNGIMQKQSDKYFS